MDTKKRYISLILFAISFQFLAAANISAEMIQPRRLVDAHTAGVLPKANFDFECRIFPAGDPSRGCGLLASIGAGLTDRLNIGISYGGEGFVGRGKNVRFNPLPGAFIKYRIFEENYFWPGIAIGYDHQGFGGIADTVYFNYNGYVNKSPGFFCAISKNYLLFSSVQLGFHGTLNYSFEEFNKVKWPNAFAGMDLGVNDELSVVAEYDFGFNVQDPDHPGRPRLYGRPQDGFLNAGIRWAFSPNFFVEFDAKDLLEKRRCADGSILGWSRELKLVYITSLGRD